MRIVAVVIVQGVMVAVAAGQAVYPSTPDWISSDTPVSTGAAVVDLDLDGWPDLVVANGNDILRQRVAVYYNHGDGTLPAVPDWQSGDVAYNGHLSVADVNGDGWPDVAVAHLGASTTLGPVARVYLNNFGTLSTWPDWQASVDGNAFGVCFGDLDNDGRPDLAVATGWPYGATRAEHNFVYANVGGTLDSSPTWESNDLNHYMNVVWADADHDGRLDLIFSGADTDTWLYANTGGTLAKTTAWRTLDNSAQFAVMITAGDVTGDGSADLFVTDNTQLFGGTGHFRQYTGNPIGYFATAPSWSYYDGYGSAIALADVNADGLLDLATGGWWDSTRMFLNTGGGFAAVPTWSSGVTSVVEKIAFGDVDRAGLRRTRQRFAPATDDDRLFYLGRQPIESVTSVTVGEAALAPDHYTYGREHGWLSIGVPAGGETVEIEFLFSASLDQAVTNWGQSEGNFLYYNQLLVTANCDGDTDVDLADHECFVDCAAGPGAWVDPDACGTFDLDVDGDVDLADWAAFQALVASP